MISRLLIFIILHCLLNPELVGQYSVDLGCMDESEAFIGLDRKAWTNNISDVSESYQINFDIPESQNFSCSVLERIEVSINGFSPNNNIPSECYLWLWTHALNCSDNTPISCSEILFDQQGLSTQFEIDGQDITEGTTIGIDIVVVVDQTNLSCVQEAISSGLYDASFEICLVAFYIPDEVEEPLDLGEDIIICEGVTVELEGPDDFEIYEWEGPIDSDEQLLENAVPGLYFLEVTDSNGCRSSDDIQIDIIEMEDIAFDNSTDLVFCINDPETINVVNYQGSQFDIEWNNIFGQEGNGPEISLDTSGIYEVIVTDTDNDCTVSATINVSIIEVSNAQIAGDSILCEGGSTILNAVISENDSIPYIIEWYVGLDTIKTDSLLVTQADTIVLSLTDSLLCGTSFDTIALQYLPEESAGFDNSATTCINDSIDLLMLLDPTSSANGYWVERATGNQLMSPQFEVPDMPGSYEYYYVIENLLPCSNDTALFTIFVSDIDVDAGQDMEASFCQEDMVMLETLISGDTGGFFTNESGNQISNTEFVASELNSGQNIINYIIESGNCGNDSAELLLIVFEEIPETVFDDALCPDASVSVNNTTYDIINTTGSEVLMSSSGCDSIVLIDLEFHEEAQVMISNLLCTGDSIIIEGEIYNETNSAGTIIIPGGSAFGCDSTIIIDLSFADFVDTLISFQLCENQSVTISNELFDLNNPSNTIILENGASNGCDSIINVDLTFTSALFQDIQDVLCPDDQIIVNGSIYNFTNPTGSESLIASNGCDSIIDVSLSFYMQGEMDMVVDLCDDETFQIGTEIYGSQNLGGVSLIENGDINGCDSIINVFINYGQSIELSNAETICENDSIFIVDEWINIPGNYTDTLLTFNGCDSIINTQISLMICNVDFQSAIVNETCAAQNDGSFQFEILNTSQYPLDYVIEDAFSNPVSQGQIFTSNPVTINNLAPGNYTVSVSKDGQSLVTEVFEIISAIPIIIDGDVFSVPCYDGNGGLITLNVEGGSGSFSILWDGGEISESLSDLDAGTYSVTVTDSEGCSKNETYEVNQSEEIQFELNTTDSNCTIANNGIISVVNISGGIPPFSYSLDGVTFSSSNTFENLSPGAYTVYINDQNDCEKSNDITIGNADNLEIIAPNSISINLGESTQVSVELNFDQETIEWTPSFGLSCSDCISPIISPTSSTSYQIIATDAFGCQAASELFVEVIVPEADIFVPNIFTPFSKDSSNSDFAPLYDLNSNIQITSFRVFDRWGNLVFTESLNQKAWKGFINGEKAQQGIYMYAVEFKDGDNDILKTGQVLLIW